MAASFLWPNGSTTRPTISSPYGPRTGGAYSFHYGCDFTGYSEVKAVASGKVTFAGWMNSNAGNAVAYDLGFKGPKGETITIVHMHLYAINARIGDLVTAGKRVGFMGDTGNATGRCDHVEIRYWLNGSYTTYNPVEWLGSRIGGTTAGTGGGSVNTGTWTTKQIQEFLNTLGLGLVVDGDYGQKTTDAVTVFQGWMGASKDGAWGPITEGLAKVVQAGGKFVSRATKDIQNAIKAAGVWDSRWPIDGEWGNQSSTGTFRYQKKVNLTADAQWGAITDAKAFPPVAPEPEKLVITGKFDTPTVQAFQRSLGVDDDGALGPVTWKAFQTAVGFTGSDVDGVPGMLTYKALQMNLGLNATGNLDTATISALQKHLNDGLTWRKVDVPRVTLPAAQPRAITYPGEIRAWLPPYAYRISDGKLNVRPAGIVVNRVIVHHTATTADQEEYFKSENTRVSCPSWNVTAAADVIGFIPIWLKPSSTGEANDYSVAIEVVNQTADYQISEEQRVAVAKIIAWLSQQTSVNGVAFDIKLDRVHVIGHNEAGVNPTACPGPYMDVDHIVELAQGIVAPPEDPDEPEDPEVPADKVLVDRVWLEEISADIEGILA